MKSGENWMKNGHLQYKIDQFDDFCEFFQEFQIVLILQAYTDFDQVMGNLIPERSGPGNPVTGWNPGKTGWKMGKALKVGCDYSAYVVTPNDYKHCCIA